MIRENQEPTYMESLALCLGRAAGRHLVSVRAIHTINIVPNPKCRSINELRGLRCYGFLDQRSQCRLLMSISLWPVTFALVIASSMQTRTIQCDTLGMISDSAHLYVSTLLQSCIRDLVHIMLFKIWKQM